MGRACPGPQRHEGADRDREWARGQACLLATCPSSLNTPSPCGGIMERHRCHPSLTLVLLQPIASARLAPVSILVLSGFGSPFVLLSSGSVSAAAAPAQQWDVRGTASFRSYHPPPHQPVSHLCPGKPRAHPPVSAHGFACWERLPKLPKPGPSSSSQPSLSLPPAPAGAGSDPEVAAAHLVAPGQSHRVPLCLLDSCEAHSQM